MGLAHNDDFRTTGRGGQLLFSRGISELPRADRAAILERVRTFDDFTPDNDPRGEHDYGSSEHAGLKIYWKIDYYDTTRVLTVRLAKEY
jgi:hypothetical protein